MKTHSFLRNSRNLFDERLLGIAAILIVAFAISYAAPAELARVGGGGAKANFPATVCPAKLGDGATTVFLPTYKTPVRHVVTKSISFYKSRTASENLASNALLVDSNPATSFAFNNSGNGIGTVICESGNADQWFVGASGGVTSKALLDIVNSGLSPALVEITAYSSKQARPPIAVSVPANSDHSILVDAIAPGDESVVLHVVTRSGRVTSFLFDQRKKGLKSLGSDYVNSQAPPSKRLLIPAILQSSSGKVSSTLRVLVPGNLDANIKVTINSGDGSFTPVGLDGKVIPHGKVLDIPLTSLTSSTPMSMVIDSDEPIVASVLTQFVNNDFAWATPVSSFKDIALNFTGISPKVVFTGSQISVKIKWKNANGKSQSAQVTGSDIAFWNPGNGGIRAVTFSNSANQSKQPVYGGVIIRTASGWQIAYLPLAAGATLEKSSLPIVDVRSLSR